MCKRRISSVALVGVLLTAGYLVASTPNKSGKAKRTVIQAQPKSTFIPSPEALAKLEGLDNPANLYTIEPQPMRGDTKPRTPKEDELFKEAVTVISRFRPIPDARIQFFNWIGTDEFPGRIFGWSIFIHEVTPIPGGWMIDLRVWPKVDDGAGAQVVTAYREQYTWAGGTLNFVKGFHEPRTPSPMVIW